MFRPGTVQLTEDQALSRLWQRLRLLPQLTELNLRVNVNLTAADIGPLSRLQHLQRLDLRLKNLQSTRTSQPGELLTTLQHLTQLQHLNLHHTDCTLYRVSAQQHQCFSALTASTQLTGLQIVNLCWIPVPQPAFQHMFPPGRVLPYLKELQLAGTTSAWRPCVEAAQVGMIAASCPALQNVNLQGVTSNGFDVSCLAQLPAGVTVVEGLDWTRPTP
jgi:hypothetical protein